MTSTQIRACRSVCGSLLNTYPQSFSYSRHDAIRRTVYTLRLEKNDEIEGDVRKECSLEIALKSGSECFPVEFS